MLSEESDVEMKTTLPKKVKKKTPKSPTEDILKGHEKKTSKKTVVIADELKTQKVTTKTMIVAALKELHTRKGVSMYAIKKYLTEKYNFDTEKNNYLIKKSIKVLVEDGTVIQMKGIGASGSFKLAPSKEKKQKKKAAKEEKDGEEKPMKKPAQSKSTKVQNKNEEKIPKKKQDAEKVPKKMKATEKVGKIKKQDKNGVEVEKKAKVKIAKGMQTPAKKKAAMMKRKSIGSIIKPPRMRPKAMP